MGSVSNLLQKRWKLREKKQNVLFSKTTSNAWWREVGLCVGRAAQVFTKHLLCVQQVPYSYNPHHVDTMTQVGKLRLSVEQWFVQGHKYHVLWRFSAWSLPKRDSLPEVTAWTHSHQGPVMSSSAHCTLKACRPLRCTGFLEAVPGSASFPYFHTQYKPSTQ